MLFPLETMRFDPALSFSFGQVCRVLRGYYLSALQLVSSGEGNLNSEVVSGVNRVPRLHIKDARSRIEEALGACLLPSLQLIPANPAVGQEIWEVMSLLPYEVGFTSMFYLFLPFEKLFGMADILAR